MSELLKKQNYGVEVEFTGISRKMAADAVAEIIGTTASRPDHTCYQTRTIQDSQGRKWKVMRDSSINPIRKVGTENTDEYRVEFVTPVLKYEDLDTLQAIIRKFRESRGAVPSAATTTLPSVSYFRIRLRMSATSAPAFSEIVGDWLICVPLKFLPIIIRLLLSIRLRFHTQLQAPDVLPRLLPVPCYMAWKDLFQSIPLQSYRFFLLLQTS